MRDGLSFLNDKLCEADELMYMSEQVFLLPPETYQGNIRASHITA